MYTMNEQPNFPGTPSDFSDTETPDMSAHESAPPVEETVQANSEENTSQPEADVTPVNIAPADEAPEEVTATDATPVETPIAQAPVDETTPTPAPADVLGDAAAAVSVQEGSPAEIEGAKEAEQTTTPADDSITTADAAEDAAAKEAAAKEAAAARAARSEEGRRRAQENWLKLAGSKESGQILEGTVTAAVKGGLLVDLHGFRGFLPASQVRVEKGTALDTLVKQKLPLRVIDVDEGRRRVVVSHRKALESKRRSERAELLRSLTVGEDRDATVMRLTDFGAFVDLGGVDALIPMNELAFERVEKASDVVQPGEKIKVRVIRVDQGGKKIAVSRKGALPDPWRDASQTLRQGNVVEGKVVAKEPRLQVEIAPGVVGSISDREANPEDYEIGEAVEVSVRSVDWRGRRLRLSTMHHAAQTISSSGFAPLGEELKSRR
jgi:ribosomal protein S1